MEKPFREDDLEITLHIGSLKTGSTYIQNTIWKNRSMFGKFGTLIPKTGTKSNHHYGVACCLGFSSAAEFEDRRTRLLNDLYQELADSELPYALISSEHFDIRPTDESVAATRDFFRDYPTRILVILRNQLDFAQSVYFESIKWGSTQTFEEFVEEHLSIGSFDYLSKVARWREKGFYVTVLDFDAVKSDLLRQFLHTLPSHPPFDQLELPDGIVNESLSPEAMEFIRRRNTELPDVEDRREEFLSLYRRLHNSGSHWAKSRPVPLPGILLDQIGHFTEANARLARSIGKGEGFLKGSLSTYLDKWEQSCPLRMDRFVSDEATGAF